MLNISCLYRTLLPDFVPHSPALTHATGTRLTVALGTYLEVRLRLRLRLQLQLHLYLQLPPLLWCLLLRLALLLVMLISFRRWRLPATPDGGGSSSSSSEGNGDGDAANDVFNWFSCCTSPVTRCPSAPLPLAHATPFTQGTARPYRTSSAP